MNRPEIKLKRTNKDNLFIGVTILAVIISFALVIMSYSKLPDGIAHHFDGRGNPNAFGSKASLIALPIISLFISGFMLLLCRIPQSFNYLVPITPDNAEIQYSMATNMMRVLAIIISLMMLHLTYETIEIGFGNQQKLSSYFLFIWLSLIGIAIVMYFLKARKTS